MSRLQGLLASLVVVGAVALAWCWSHGGQDTAAWKSHLDAARDQELAQVLFDAIESGPAGIEAVVASLSSGRPGLASEAERQLTLAVDRWELLPPPVAGERLAPLAQTLAAQIEQLDDAGKSAAANLALRLLLCSSPSGTTRSQVIDCCDQILRRSGPATPPLIASEPVLASRATHQPDDIFVPREAVASTASSRGDEWRFPPLPQPNGAIPSNPFADRAPPGVAARPAELPETATAEARRLPETGLNTPAPAIVPAAAQRDLRPAPAWESLDVVALYQHWHQGEHREQIELEFARRHYTPRQIEVGRALTDPDRNVRLRALEALPGVTGIDSAPWLMYLSRDSEAEVRLAAVAMMATSGEPGLLRRVAEMARLDGDERVRSQAGKLR